MTTPDPASFDEQVRVFAEEVADLLERSFPDAPQVLTTQRHGRSWIELDPKLVLRIGGQAIATIDVAMRCGTDSTRSWLALEKSWIKLTALVDKTPILRWEYERRPKKVPAAHLQVHGHRGALSHLLSRAGHPAPHSMEALHLPVGGARFRPALEDVVEFLVADCRFDHREGWREAVVAGRERWRRLQIRSAVRDAPQDAAEALRRLGYQVTPPSAGAPHDDVDRLRSW